MYVLFRSGLLKVFLILVDFLLIYFPNNFKLSVIFKKPKFKKILPRFRKMCMNFKIVPGFKNCSLEPQCLAGCATVEPLTSRDTLNGSAQSETVHFFFGPFAFCPLKINLLNKLFTVHLKCSCNDRILLVLFVKIIHIIQKSIHHI